MRNVFYFCFIVVIIGLYSSFFVINEGTRGIVLRFDKVERDQADKAVIYEPGLHIKLPFIETVRSFDSRIQTMENPVDRFMTNETKELLVDSYLKWRIVDFNRFYVATHGGDMNYAESLLKKRLNDRLRAEFGCKDIKGIVSDSRGKLTEVVKQAMNGKYVEISVNCFDQNKPEEGSTINEIDIDSKADKTQPVIKADVEKEPVQETAKEEEARKKAIADSSVVGLGIEVVDVRIKQINLPEEVSQAIFERMRKDRNAVAQHHRSQGLEQSEKNRANTDYMVMKILSEARSEATRIQGEGDAAAAKIYAEAYSKDPEFYSFLRSLRAYEQGFNNGNNIVVLSPDTPFFRFMVSPDGIKESTATTN